MTDGPFDHLEIKGDESNLPEELKPALRNCMCKRLEFGPALTASGKVMALRTERGKLWYANDEMMPAWFDDLLHFVGERGLTPAFQDLARSMDISAVLVESLPAKAAPPGTPAAPNFDVENWSPEKGAPTGEQLDSIPATRTQWLLRGLVALLPILAWLAYQAYYLHLPEAGRRKMLAREWCLKNLRTFNYDMDKCMAVWDRH